jgi:hypothetical protein
MINSNVPILSSGWSGTGTVVVPSPVARLTAGAARPATVIAHAQRTPDLFHHHFHHQRAGWAM